jgi:hypothetical protein
MPKKWEWSDIANGCAQVKLTSWKVFSDFVSREMLDFEDYIWRGQRCDNWDLESTLDRLIKKAKIAKTKRWDFRKLHLEQFKYAARGRRGINPPVITNENEWWALGQHHGLSTPLLDWTTSPFVAAYFAFINQGDGQTRNRSIYAIHKTTVERRVRSLKKEQEAKNQQEKADIASGKKPMGLLSNLALDAPVRPQVEFIRPLSDENQRLVNQGGLFTRAPDGKALDTWVSENNNTDGYTLIKILIPNKDRMECLKTLNRMNINHLTLFPDLYGATKFCNLFGEIEKY